MLLLKQAVVPLSGLKPETSTWRRDYQVFFFRISSHLAWWHRQVGEREVVGPKAGKSHVINTRVPPQNHIGEISLFLKKYGR